MAEEAGTSTGTTEAGQEQEGTLLGGQQPGILDWRSTLPESLRSAPIIQRHQTLEAAAKSLTEQDRMLGRALFLPEDTADDATKQAAYAKVYDKLGRPGKAEEYQLPVPDGQAMDPEIAGRWQKAFHQAGLSQSQVAEVMAEYWRTVDYAGNVVAGAEARSYEEGRRALYAEFGASTEDMIAKARGFVEHFGAGAFGGKAGTAAWEEIQQAKLPDGRMLMNSPHLVAAFAEAFTRIGEGEWHESSYYQPGQNTVDTLTTRHRELTAKRHGAGLSSEEQSELIRVAGQLAQHRDRQAARAGRVA